MRLQLAGPDRFQVTRITDDDIAQPRLQILARSGQAEDRHHFGRNHNIKAVLTRKAIAGASQRNDGRTQGTVIHVHDATPDNAAEVKAQRITVMNVVVDQRGQQVVCQRNGVEVTREVQVDVFHRHHLGVATTGSATFHAKHGSQRRFAQRNHRALADPVQRIPQTHHGCGLALAGRRRADGGNQHQLAVRAGLLVQPGQIDLGLVVAVRLQRLCRNAQALLRHLQHRFERCRLGDFNVRRNSPDGCRTCHH